MPLVRPDAFAFGILLLCVPIQYLLVKYWGHTELGRTHALNRLIKNFGKFQSEYLEWESWRNWCWELVYTPEEEEEETGSYDRLYPVDPNDPMGESPAVEVMKYKQKEGYFALSPIPRTNRSPDVKFRIGQVVIHKFWNYRGVIIGWDEIAKAPLEWLNTMHGDENRRWRSMPNYAVLVDVRDRLTPQITYVPEENLTAVKNTRVIHPLVDDHFEGYNGFQYIPRPWLKAVYPKD